MSSYQFDPGQLPPRGPAEQNPSQPSMDRLVFSGSSAVERRQQVQTFFLAAQTRRELQEDFPEWQPTERQRWAIGVLRDCAAVLHPDALIEGPITSLEQEVAEASFIAPVSSAIQNLVDYCSNSPLRLLTAGNRTIDIDVSADRETYEREYVGALWAVKTSFVAARENETLFCKLLELFDGCSAKVDLICDNTIFRHTLWTAHRLSYRSPLVAQVIRQNPWVDAIFQMASKNSA